MIKKKGMSVIIGYVLLIAFGLVIAILVYQNIEKMIPKELTTCEDGLSLNIKKMNFQDGILNLTIINSGKFYVDGYYLKSSIDSELETATKDITSWLDKMLSKQSNQGSILFQSKGVIYFDQSGTEKLGLGAEVIHIFSEQKCDEGITLDGIKFLELIPIRFEKVGDQAKMAVCENAKIKETVQE